MRLVNHSHPISGVGALTADRPDHLPEIRDGLRAGISALAVHLLGDPVRGGRTTKTLKFGTRSGSLHVEISGPKQGLWFDHAENLGGDALALIQHINGGSFPDAVSWAANWLGIDIGRPVPKPAPDHAAAQQRERERKRAEAAAQEAQDAAERVSRARRLWSRRKSLAGSLGSVYLASRGITEPAGGWPDAVGFLPASSVTFPDKNQEGREVWRNVPCGGAFILAATDESGEVQAVQRIYVDHAGRNIRDWNGGKIKITNGDMSGTGAVVRLRAR